MDYEDPDQIFATKKSMRKNISFGGSELLKLPRQASQTL